MPVRTLNSWGSSSREYLRSAAPMRVTRGSWRSLNSGPAPWFSVWEGGEAGLGVHDHRTELHHRELAAVEADAGLPEERGTAVGADGEGQREQDGGQRDEEQQRRQHVQRGFQETGEPGDRPGRRRGGSGGVGSAGEGDRAGAVLHRDPRLGRN